MKSIWLFKAESESNDNYGELLLKNNFSSTLIPTLNFNFINTTRLENALRDVNGYYGMVLTSTRSVEAVSKIYNTLPFEITKQWSSKKVFVIGKATNDVVINNLGLVTSGNDSGNAAQLADFIIKEVPAFEKPLLFPCGNLKRDELPTLLAKNDINFSALISYETNIHPQLETTLLRIYGKPEDLPEFMVFFSPSGVQFALPLFEKLQINLVRTKVIALGPTTNAALVNENVPVYGICPDPSPAGLLHVIKSNIK